MNQIVHLPFVDAIVCLCEKKLNIKFAYVIANTNRYDQNVSLQCD